MVHSSMVHLIITLKFSFGPGRPCHRRTGPVFFGSVPRYPAVKQSGQQQAKKPAVCMSCRYGCHQGCACQQGCVAPGSVLTGVCTLGSAFSPSTRSSTGPWARASSARATRRQLPPPKLLPHGHCAGLRQRRSKTHSGSLPVGAAVASFPALCRPASRRVIVQAPPGAPCGRLAQLQSLPCPAVQHCRACLWPQCENRGPLRICCGPSFSVHFLSGRRVGVTCAGC